jgi:hypothetical protein
MTKWQRYFALAGSLVVLAIVVTVTSAGSAIAQGAIKPVEALIVNGLSNPVPVRTVPVTAGSGGTLLVCPQTNDVGPATASALSIHMDPNVELVYFRNGSDFPARFEGPANFADESVVLALTRPIAFDSVTCTGSGSVRITWIGNTP